MKLLRYLSHLILLASLLTNCSTAQNFQRTPPMKIEGAYSQKWSSGVEGGGSGVDVYISFSDERPESIHMDSVYFRGKVTNLEVSTSEDKKVYIGRFKTKLNMPENIVMSGDSNEEYGNQLQKTKASIPFDLKNTECVIRYTEAGEIKYFKLENIREKIAQHYPNTSSNKH